MASRVPEYERAAAKRSSRSGKPAQVVETAKRALRFSRSAAPVFEYAVNCDPLKIAGGNEVGKEGGRWPERRAIARNAVEPSRRRSVKS